MNLNDLRPQPGSTHSPKRKGRGIGSGLGKTAGRGVKGQKSRSGVAIKGFEGGQMPLHRRLPKRGFVNPNGRTYNEINLGKLQAAVDAGKLDAGATVDDAALVAAGLVRRPLDGTRILGQGELKAKLDLKVAGASKSAREAIEAAGGTIETTVAAKAAADEEE